MALDMDLPKTVMAHGHWTMDQKKMSKSKGNVADPFAALELFGVDVIRYYMMLASGTFRSDSGACIKPVSESERNLHLTLPYRLVRGPNIEALQS